MEQSALKKKALYGSFILLQCFIWGIGNPLTKMGLASFTPFYCMAVRFAIAFAVFLLIFRKKAFAGITRKNLPHCLIIGVFTAAAYLLSILALQYTTATRAGFLLSLSVLFTPIFSRFMLRSRLDKRILLIILIVVFGMYLLCGNEGSFSFGIGELCAVLSSVSLAVAITYSSKYIHDVGAPALSTVQAGVAAVLSTLFALLFEDFHVLTNISPFGWLVILYLALGCTVAAYLLQNTALKHVSAVTVSFAFCSEPIFTAAAAFLLLGELLLPIGLWGAGLILLGLLLAAFLQARSQKALP